METRIINQESVPRLLPMAECIDCMREVLTDLAKGLCQLPLRNIMWLPEKVGALGLMPSYWKSHDLIGLKAVSYFPGNAGTEYDSHQGAVLLYEAKRGRLLAIVDATSITAIRTAAVSAVATKLLARSDACRLAIIGAGVQARVHLEAMRLCRDITSIRVCGKSLDRAKRFAKRESDRHSIKVDPVASVKEAVADADIICTTTSSTVPVLKGEWIKPGTHINAIGASTAPARELDAHAVRISRLFVDLRESALEEAGDFLLAKKEGAVNDDHIQGEIGELLAGKAIGRTSPDDITLFKSVGLAVEDLASAYHIFNNAVRQNAGMKIEFGGARRETD